MAAVQPSLLQFLKKLAKNNDREWFEEHKPAYKKEEFAFKAFGNVLLQDLQQHDAIEKMKVYRIYRDIRFSKDKTPFKTNRTISFVREGTALRGGYYLHIQSGNSFLAGGFFSPAPADLKRIRQEFDLDDTEIRQIMDQKKFKATFGSEFVPHDQVKTAPKGFSKESKAIDLIKNKSYFFQHHYTDAEVTDPNFSETIDEHYRLLRPFFDYMSDVLTTDLNGVSLLDAE